MQDLSGKVMRLKGVDGCTCSQYSGTPVTVLGDENLSFPALSSTVNLALGDCVSFGHKRALLGEEGLQEWLCTAYPHLASLVVFETMEWDP